jgi:hypothetical protein
MLRRSFLLAITGLASGAEMRRPRITPKAVYLSSFGLGAPSVREPVIRLLQETELNALVIDVKGDRGWIAYPSSIALAQEIGAQKIIPAKNGDEIIRSLKSMGVYLIARIVVFKDNPLALARPSLAVKTSGGSIWRDREHLSWVDPFQPAVWTYNLDIAEEAARKGFDEIQFDYVRFPDARGLVFSRPNNRENRVQAIDGFFREARKRLASHKVFLAGDIFGYVCWNQGDTDIGQQIDTIVSDVDYVCPMLYPSGFKYGIPGYRKAAAYPYEIVRFSLDKAFARTQADKKHFRPWLQAFRDYAFDRRVYGPQEIRTQIRAAEEFGSDGWMVWNPHNVYPGAGFRPKQPVEYSRGSGG